MNKTPRESIDEIRKLLEAGHSQKEAAQITGVSENTICRLKKRGLLGGTDKPGEEARQIDLKKTRLPKLKPGQRIDGTPDMKAMTAPEDRKGDRAAGAADGSEGTKCEMIPGHLIRPAGHRPLQGEGKEMEVPTGQSAEQETGELLPPLTRSPSLGEGGRGQEQEMEVPAGQSAEPETGGEPGKAEEEPETEGEPGKAGEEPENEPARPGIRRRVRLVGEYAEATYDGREDVEIQVWSRGLVSSAAGIVETIDEIISELGEIRAEILKEEAEKR